MNDHVEQFVNSDDLTFDVYLRHYLVTNPLEFPGPHILEITFQY